MIMPLAIHRAYGTAPSPIFRRRRGGTSCDSRGSAARHPAAAAQPANSRPRNRALLQLFRRKPRGVELTPAGEAFLADARIVLERAEHAVLAARRAARGEAGRLGLGFTSSASFHPLGPRATRDFREAGPLAALTPE